MMSVFVSWQQPKTKTAFNLQNDEKLQKIDELGPAKSQYHQLLNNYLVKKVQLSFLVNK